MSNSIPDHCERIARCRRPAVVWLLIAVGVICVPAALLATRRDRAAVHQVDVIGVFPHDPRAYTQGLVFDNGTMFEGTGQYGESTLRQVDSESGRIERSVKLPRRVFGEGITVWKDQIIQLTWKRRHAIVYDRETLQQINTREYTGEGWGLTHNGTHLIMSDGSSTLRFLDPETFRVVRRLSVREGKRRIQNLNELEYVDEEIFANIWYSDFIARISPTTGEVTGWIDLRDVWPANKRLDREKVLNGIAWDAAGRRLFVTGKNWPKLYEIRIRR